MHLRYVNAAVDGRHQTDLTGQSMGQYIAARADPVNRVGQFHSDTLRRQHRPAHIIRRLIQLPLDSLLGLPQTILYIGVRSKSFLSPEQRDELGMDELDRRTLLTALTGAATLPITASRVHADEEPPARRKIRIGQIGTGHAHAAGKLRTVKALPDEYEIVGVVENDPARRKALGDTYQGVKLISEDQLLNTPEVSAVSVETEIRDLVPTALRCIRAGCHVHLDKPAGESLDNYKRLLNEATRRKLVVQMGYIYRYHPAIRLCVQAIQDGWLGEVFEVDGVISKTVSAESRRRLVQYKGGSMFELGCHLIDVVVWLLGEPTSVAPFIRRTRPDQDNLADNQLAILEYPKATATVRSALVEVMGPRRRQLVVCGDRGTFELQPLKGRTFKLTLDRARGSYKQGYQEITLSEAPRRYVGDFRELAAVIREEKRPDFSPQHDLAVHHTVLTASGYE